jgi:hypothetical protein
MDISASFSDKLTAFAGPAGGGAAIGAAVGYMAAAIARDLGRDAAVGDYVAGGTGLGAIFGLAVAVLDHLGVH